MLGNKTSRSPGTRSTTWSRATVRGPAGGRALWRRAPGSAPSPSVTIKQTFNDVCVAVSFPPPGRQGASPREREATAPGERESPAGLPAGRGGARLGRWRDKGGGGPEP